MSRPHDESLTSTSLAPTVPGSETLLFGRYRPVKRLGSGGMGVVMLARDDVLDLHVALKLLPEEVVHSPADIHQLKKEVLHGMALTHPGIVRVFSFEQTADRAAIVMEFVDGETLADLMTTQAGNCFEHRQILPWLEQLCAVLEYAHTEGKIAHRDLKPRNLLLNIDGRLKVADLGISSPIAESMLRLSTRQAGAGTPPYMSPQQVLGERPSHLDDIYSLGATAYDLLTGKPPFFRGHILTQVHRETAPPLNERRAELGVTGKEKIPDSWEQTIAACLAKNPAERPPSARAFLAALAGDATLPAAAVAAEQYRFVPLVDPAPPKKTETGPAHERPHHAEPPDKQPPPEIIHETHHRPAASRRSVLRALVGKFVLLLLASAGAAGVFELVRHAVSAPPPQIAATPEPTPARTPSNSLRGSQLQPATDMDEAHRPPKSRRPPTR